jgi:ABC-2 type transport system permease protein
MTDVTFVRVLRFEWIKFWSLRSSWATLALAFVVTVGTGPLVCWLSYRNGPEGSTIYDLAGASMAGSSLAVLIVGVLGVLVMTGEYATGTIRSTLVAVPRRLPVLAAKVVVSGAATFLLMPAVVVSFLVSRSIIVQAGVAFPAGGVLRVMAGNVAYLIGAGLFGLLLGAVLRSTAAALTTYFGVMFFLGTVVTQVLLPQSMRESVGKFLPAAAGEAMCSGVQLTEALHPGPAALVFAGYLVLLGALGCWRLMRSDAT